MPRSRATLAIPAAALLLTAAVISYTLAPTADLPPAPTATFAILTDESTPPVPPSAVAAVADPTQARLLGTDASGHAYLLRRDGPHVCVSAVRESLSRPAMEETCGASTELTSQIWWNTLDADGITHLVVLIPDEYANATLITSGTRRQILREPNLGVFALHPGAPAHLTLDSAVFRDLSLDVTVA